MVAKARKSAKKASSKKASKAKKATKTKKRAARPKVIGSRRSVMSGTVSKTSGGLTKSDMTKNKSGKFVSKKKQAHGRKVYKNIRPWNDCVQKARKVHGIKGFCAVGGPTAIGQKLLKTARQLYKQAKG